MTAGEAMEFIDVRTPEERASASIPGTVLLDAAQSTRIEGLGKDTKLVFHCHHGGRSQKTAEHFVGLGFSDVVNLAGGIDAWSMQVDSGIPRY
jgi:monothiol glutaredoxin